MTNIIKARNLSVNLTSPISAIFSITGGKTSLFSSNSYRNVGKLYATKSRSPEGLRSAAYSAVFFHYTATQTSQFIAVLRDWVVLTTAATPRSIGGVL